MAAITLSELWHGYHRASSAAAPRRRVFVKGMKSTIPVAEFATKEALIHAKIWADLERAGEKSATNTLSSPRRPSPMGFPVATLNKREFGRVRSLRLVSLQRFLL